ncbi:hypothetical protein QBC47DRAFT_414335 [Echria macrotheca]|uniref:Uncharacterized protein n=1 Tax=Echria macrotheca TaxID=438768 RepID=A0AAJ0B9V6_9PEZI|nr:hypothetical protein QBC47DRAFT_414335 [Echria macrotheca]
MSVLWLFLPSSWDLGNVRAILALLINFLSVIGVWVVAYSAWKVAALKTVRRHKPSTRLLSLYSPTGLGDVLDIVPLLRPNMGVALLAQILVPAFLIAVLSGVAIASAVIARYSTRLGLNIQQTPVSGILANNNHSGIGNALVKWNATIDRFNSAGFPLNQLADFLPDTRVDWRYAESEWNSSWTASCKWTDRTPVTLYATGNTSNTGHLFSEIQGLREIFPPEILVEGYTERYIAVGPFYNDIILDNLIFVSIQTDPDKAYDETTQQRSNYLPFHFTVAAVHVKDAPANFSQGSGASWGTGPIGGAWYTMASCDLERVASRTPDKLDEETEIHIAYPWAWDYATTNIAFGTFYEAALTEQSFNGQPVYHPSGPDLFRFYQAYLATKDTQNLARVDRVLSVAVPTSELSVPMLVVFLVYLLALAGVAFWFVVVTRLPGGSVVPRTKVDWMAQLVAGERSLGGDELGGRARGRGGLWSALRRARFVTVESPGGGVYGTVRMGSGGSGGTFRVEEHGGNQKRAEVVEVRDM